jgi:hypothetical protein
VSIEVRPGPAWPPVMPTMKKIITTNPRAKYGA